MHMEFTFVRVDDEVIKQHYDSMQLGEHIPEVGDHFILPNAEEDSSEPAMIYIVEKIIRVLPVADLPFHIHIICMEVIEEDADEDESWQSHFTPHGDN